MQICSRVMLPKPGVDPAAILAVVDDEHAPIGVLCAKHDVRGAPSRDISTSGEELHHVGEVIAVGADVLQWV